MTPAAASPRSLWKKSAIEPTPAEVEARRDYALLEQWLGGIFAEASAGALDCPDIFEDVEAILERPGLLDALFAETFKAHEDAGFLPRKSLNVAIYALRLARGRRMEGRALVDVGVAALVHNIGLARLPNGLVGKKGALGRGELAALREHPAIARRLLHPLGGRFEAIADIVYQVHERMDGSGYPQGLAGEAIHPEAQLIGLVDVFEALIQPRPYRERLVPFAAAKELLEREKNRFPRPLLREFISSFSVFPPYTYVRLNSKAIARVVEAEPGYPLRPQVAIVIDAGGNPLASPQALRLRESPLLYITGPVSQEELPTQRP